MRLISITEDNWMEVASLSVKEEQKKYVAPAIGILARGYVYRDCNVRFMRLKMMESSSERHSSESLRTNRWDMIFSSS